MSLKIAGRSIPVSTKDQTIDIKSVLEFNPFKDWAAALSKEILTTEERELEINEIEIQSVDYFGKKIGFVKFKVNTKHVESGINRPVIVFMRGGAVAVLLILRSIDENEPTMKEHVVLTYQARIPAPSLSFPEIPAGMLDGSGNFAGKCSDEIKEETGIEVKKKDLIDLTELAYGDKFRGAYPSPGGSDEFLKLFLCIKEMKKEDVKKLEGKLTGLRDEGENITVRLIKLNELWKIPDMKALSALTLYNALKNEGKI